MRRSKSNPAKYARNYRKISQRQMSQYDNIDEAQEMKRLQSLLKQSEAHLQFAVSDDEIPSKKKKKRQEVQDAIEEKQQGESPTLDDEEAAIERARNLLRNSTDHLTAKPEHEEEAMQLKPTKKGRKRDRDRGQESKTKEYSKASCASKESQFAESTKSPRENIGNGNDDASNLLSEEFKNEHEHFEESLENPLVVLPKKKKKKVKSVSRIELTPEEIKHAKQLHKKTERKLKQLTQRSEQKKRRAELYSKLESTAISEDEIILLESSSTLGKRVSKKEQLKKLIQKERAGISLTKEEHDLLYRDRTTHDEKRNSDSGCGNDQHANARNEGKAGKAQEKTGARRKTKMCPKGTNEEIADQKSSKESEISTIHDINKKEQSLPFNAASFAASMMASLTTLKTTSEKQKEENEKKRQQEEAERMRLEEERSKREKNKEKYKVTNPVVIQTAATNKKLQVHKLPASARRVLTTNRPEIIQETRYDLPVAQMEFDVMDAIRNNDVTIICGETGSGKSTQVPQLLYEAGFTLDGLTSQNHKYLIGITQPRRVAAVSTAKRVSYEMGTGDGHAIRSKKGKGNLVAYQTRYETAGLGEKTGVKFMTDGILLQEIQSDLLLRKYSVIVLDECHERNLNCDILCGLIGLALPLRKKAAEEPGSDIVPLKLVIMSATLRVDDFVSNTKLFPSTTPFVVKIPGRTFPVTIHHSRHTELDSYEDVAFNKICKIHRNLPQGGILVFLTGKHEIVRMVNRLIKTLSKRKKKMPDVRFAGSNDVITKRTDITSYSDNNAPRDLDDDEVDGDLFQIDDDEDDYDDTMVDEADGLASQPSRKDDEESNVPKDVLVLPLYSMLSAEEQARVFRAAPDGCRLIVVSTNIAETSITIPGISYVVDTGRQKCKNFDAKTGVASFDISWVSKAAANQRAGRAGRTGPGHCYRLYSSAMFSRHMDDFALPEVLIRPLEDVVLAMKAMKISSISKFPFPTPPAESQIEAAVRLLANLGCVALDEEKDSGSDGVVTPLGAAVSTLPLGVRCGKMLLVAAHAGVLDYAIAIVAALSEKNPFRKRSDMEQEEKIGDDDGGSDDGEDIYERDEKEKRKNKWAHPGGDIYAVMLAIGAYTYVGKGAGGVSEKVACKKFCQENGLDHVIMERIQKIRIHLSRLVKTRMAGADGIAAKTGNIPHTMKPPNKIQEKLLLQVIVSGLLDNVAMLAPLGSIPGSHPFSLRSAFLSSSSSLKEPLFMDRNSVIFSRDSRRLPQWVCYESLIRKNLKDGTPIATMKNITPVDAAWLGTLAKGSDLLKLGGPILSPRPSYDPARDQMICSVETKFGNNNWEIPPIQVVMRDAMKSPEARNSMHFKSDDTSRYFGRFLLEGKVFPGLIELQSYLNDSPAIMTGKAPVAKAVLIAKELSDAGIDTASKLRLHLATVDNMFLFKTLKSWIKPQSFSDAKRIWITTVKAECSNLQTKAR